jgi:hypothetical protein
MNEINEHQPLSPPVAEDLPDVLFRGTLDINKVERFMAPVRTYPHLNVS